MSDVIEKPAAKQKLEPPPRWRNWWRVKLAGVTIICTLCGGRKTAEPGDVHPVCCETYPSEEVARIVAARFIPNLLGDYVGPYREGERP